VQVDTEPAAAYCDVLRQGELLASVDSTPGIANITRTKYSIEVVCRKPGYQQVTCADSPGTTAAFWYNLYWLLPIITFPATPIGMIVDSATGSDNKYTSPLKLTLSPTASDASALVPSDASITEPTGPRQPR
jgi:hypothetical protein